MAVPDDVLVTEVQVRGEKDFCHVTHIGTMLENRYRNLPGKLGAFLADLQLYLGHDA
ncbi:hypothetical protein ACSSZE_16310 [Acidithiobacillus caldus]